MTYFFTAQPSLLIINLKLFLVSKVKVNFIYNAFLIQSTSMLIRVSFSSKPTLLLLWKPWWDSGAANALHVSVTKTVLQQEWREVSNLFTMSSPGVLTLARLCSHHS